MSGPHTDEKVVNGEMARALDARHPRWGVVAEQTRLLASSPAKKLDVLIKPVGAGLLPLPVETEFHPAATVEQDARDRLGETFAASNTNVVRAVAVRLPAHLRTLAAQYLTDAVNHRDTTFEWCVMSLDIADVAKVDRWPTSGWLSGNVDELSRFCELMLIDEAGLRAAADDIETTVEALAGTLLRDRRDRAKLSAAAQVLQQDDNEQTTKMALTLMANAFVFERAIDGTVDPNTGQQLPVSTEADTHAAVLRNWQDIINYNYWPIFHIARQVLARGVRVATAQQTVIPQLVALADRLSVFGVTATGDIAGQLFDRLITDRKFLATFYTLPASSYLLSELLSNLLERHQMLPTEKGAQLDAFRFADLACGTGALLTSLYQRIAARIRTAGDDDATTHQQFIEEVIQAADIMPAAAHLTATLLASTHPTTTFARSNIVLCPTGQDQQSKSAGTPPAEDNVSLGSLELLDKATFQLNLLAPPPSPAQRTSITGVGASIPRERTLPPESLTVCVMNPPFTSHSSNSAEAGVKNRKWAGLGRSEAEQAAMERREQSLVKARAQTLRDGLEPAYQGNVGLAATFIDLADAKLKHGGLLGLILPQSFLSAVRWRKARTLVERLYDDVVVLTIAATGQTDRAFSSDTGMAECMLVARKAQRNRSGNQRVTHVSLRRRPATLVEAVEMARSVAVFPADQNSGDLTLGDDEVCGTFLRTSQISGNAAAVRNVEVVDAAERLTSGVLALPRLASIEIPMTTLGAVASVGPNDAVIGNVHKKRNAAGPLVIHNRQNQRTKWRQFAYPTLWWHDAASGSESRLKVLPDADGKHKPGRKADAVRLWKSHASSLHLNRDFRFTSQALAACRTPGESMGGRAWPTAKMSVATWESAFVLWHNSTLGLVLWWHIASRQHQGRGSLSVERLPNLATLDYRKLTDDQHERAAAIYERFTADDTQLSFLPANEAYQDDARHTLDRAVLEEVFGLDWSAIESPLDTLRHQWCAEPTVHGGKTTQPGGAGDRKVAASAES